MLKKKKTVLLASVILIISMLAMIISASPIVKDVTAVTVSADEAENIALKYLGLTRENIRFERTEIDYERGNLVWEVEFEKGNTEYSFEIDAKTGKILQKEIEDKTSYSQRKPQSNEAQKEAQATPPATEPPTAETSKAEAPASSSTASDLTATGITRERAIEIALADAGLTRDQVRELHAERDYENGILVYEVEFENGRTDYDYDVRVSDGKILHRDVDVDD